MRIRMGIGAAAVLLLSGCFESGQGESGSGNSGGSVAMTRDAAVGARYGSAGPRSCSSKKQPSSGAPSPDQAAAYVICASEHEWGSNLYLVDKVVVTDVAAGREYERNQGSRPNIDTGKPVYAIRGSVEAYQCGPTYGGPGGANCKITHMRNASGDCYLDNFGDWNCMLTDQYAPPNETIDQPPPA